jgi:hypothetical protein
MLWESMEEFVMDLAVRRRQAGVFVGPADRMVYVPRCVI